MGESLYLRLGGRPGIEQIANDIVDLHVENPLIRTRFLNIDIPLLKARARDFICAGTGGAEHYGGKDMVRAHANMNVSEQEFLAVLDDILEGLKRNDVGQREQDEMLAICYSFKDQIIRG